MDFLTLLKEKNHFLDKFYELTVDKAPEFKKGNFEALEYFYQNRENILNIIEELDTRINLAGDEVQFNDEIEKAIEIEMVRRDFIVKRILHSDIEILSCLDQEKSNILRELQGMKKNRKAFSGYKLKTHRLILDEEA